MTSPPVSYLYTGNSILEIYISNVNPYTGSLLYFRCYHHTNPKKGNDSNEVRIWSITNYTSSEFAAFAKIEESQSTNWLQ